MPYDSPLPRVHTLGSDEGRMQHNELMDLVTKLSDRVVSLETDLQQTKKVYGAAYTKLIKKVKRLEDKLNKSRRKRRLVLSEEEDSDTEILAQEDPSKQGRKIAQIDDDEGITLVQMGAQTQGRHDHEMEADFEFTTAEDVSTANVPVNTAGAEITQIKADEELAHKLQAQERERYSEADKAKLLVELINERKRQFAQQRAQQRRNKPMTQSQQRTYMCNYIKNMGSHTLQQLKKLSFDEIKELFETTVKRVNTFTPMKSDDTVPKVVTGSSKRSAEEELGEEKRGHDVFMLVEKYYPLTRGLMTLMLCNKLQVDQHSEMADEILRKIFLLVNRPRHAWLQRTTISCDGLGYYDWSDQAEKGPTNFALMAYSSTSSNSEVSTDSNCLESVEARLLVYKKNESVYEEDIKLIKREIYLKKVAIIELRRKLELAQKQKDEIQLTVEKLENSSKSLSKLIDCQIVDKCKTGLGYNDVPPPYTGNFMPPKPDLSFSGLEEFVNELIVSEPTIKKPVVETSEAKASADSLRYSRIWKAFGGNTRNLGHLERNDKTTGPTPHLSRLWSPKSETASQYTRNVVTTYPMMVSKIHDGVAHRTQPKI
ncbi:hypothetical protein Tco_0586784 [Tanacetum coccineum]